MKTIVHVGWYNPNPVGGVGKTILEQTRALAKAGQHVEIWHFGAQFSEPTITDVGELFPVWNLPVRNSRLWRLLSLPRATRRWINSRRDEIDIIHLHSVFTPHNCVIARLGFTYVITPNGGWNDIVLEGHRKHLKKLWIRLFERPMWKHAAFIQGVSHEEIRQIRSRQQIASIRYIPNGTAIPESCSETSMRNCVLFIGRYDIRQKGLDVMFEAIRLLVAKGVGFPKIVLAGPDYRGGKETLEKFLIEHKLTEAVELLGPVQDSEKDALFRRALLFIHTSRWEGLPLVLLEALSYGIPCLLTPGTNVASEWSAAGCAFEVAFEPEEIANAIAKTTRMDLSDASAAAKRLAQSEYSWPRISSSLIEMYQDAINQTSNDAIIRMK